MDNARPRSYDGDRPSGVVSVRVPVMAFSLLLLVVGVACGPEPVCGEDEDGNEYPVCTYELDGDLTIDYCPGDQWAATDGCNSCACDGKGKILCTSVTCP
jgi:hypothetical protein